MRLRRLRLWWALKMLVRECDVIMKELDAIDDQSPQPRWPWFVIIGACILLTYLLKYEGVALSAVILVAAFFVSRYQPNSLETDALKSSIALSREDIEDVLAKYDEFLSSTDADAIADRTLHRPALADEDCTDPDISAFHFLAASSRRFASRVNARLKRNLNVQQLEALLVVTDRRALELKEAWLQARRAAHRLGQDYI